MFILDKGLNGVGEGLNEVGERSKDFLSKFKPPARRVTSPTDVYALTNLTLCYYIGDDVLNSHLQFNKQWKFDLQHTQGLHTYLNQLTLGTNYMLGLQNYKLKWKGPYARSDKTQRYPGNMEYDTKRTRGCDVVVFMVFNDFIQEQETSGKIIATNTLRDIICNTGHSEIQAVQLYKPYFHLL